MSRPSLPGRPASPTKPFHKPYLSVNTMAPSEHPLFDVVVRAVQTDIAQLVEYDVEPEPLAARLAEVAAAGSMDALLEFQMEVWRTPQPEDYPYEEPSEPQAIRALWPTDTSLFEGDHGRLRDKIAGAWLGRAAGCCLGKPFEMNLDRREVEALCVALDSWPLLDYVNTWKEGEFPHSQINSALVILGILFGDGDFSRTIGLTVSGGRDTDCTGAAAGSLMGAAYGQGKIPESWYQCLNDTYRSVMKGCHEMAFSDLIARTEVVARRLGRF